MKGSEPLVLTDAESKTRRVLVIVAVLLGVLGGTAFAQGGGPPSAPIEGRLSDEEAEAKIAGIKEVAADADIVLESFASPRLDREFVLEARDYDLERIFQWVKSETRWVPYRGILRGAAGVQMDHRGNSLDRSLFLAALLEDAGFETRLARSSLSREMATALLESHAYNQVEGSPQPSKAGEIEAVREKQQEVEAQARDLVKLSGLSASLAGEPWTDELLADISDHWWVQVKHGSEWQDLDPMTTDGVSLLEAGSLSTYTVDRLPEDLHHRLEIRVVIERWEEGRLVEEVPLTHGFAVAEIPLFTHVDIDFLPLAEEWVYLEEADGGLDALQIAESARFWRPTLRVDGKIVSGEWFSTSGRFELPTTLAAAKKLKSATGALSALGGKQPENAADTHLTAVWLEYESSDPGNRGERVRRELFDLLGVHREKGRAPKVLSLSATDERERGLALQGRTSSLVLTSTPHPDAVEKAVIESWSENRNAFIALVYLAAGWEDERVPLALSQGEYRPIDLLAMASLREIWSRHPDLTYLDRANVLSWHLIRVVNGDTTDLQFVTDVVMHRMGVVPGAPLDPRLVRLEQGVLDTLVETTFSRGEEIHNTFHHFAERSKGSDEWIAIPTDLSTGDSLVGLPTGDRARIRSAIRNGKVVVSSSASYALGDYRHASWWRIDPSDGTTLGIGYRGWGTETAEYGGETTVDSLATKETAEEVGEAVVCKLADATIEITLDVTFQAILEADRNMTPERRRLIRKIKDANPGGYSDLPCRFGG